MAELFDFAGYLLPVHLINKTGAGIDTFEAISEWHIGAINHHIGIKASDVIVEVGCGIGRDAIPLTKILNDNGSYLGTDVIRESIEWCQSNITDRHPNFRFVWHDISDSLHNPGGTLSASEIILPQETGSADLIIMQSVFTHMFEDEIIHYMQEFNRILKPSGRIWTSLFIVDKNILSHVAKYSPTSYSLSFMHAYEDGCYINTLDMPRGAVAFERHAVERMLNRSGLEHVREPLRGSWSEVWPEPEFGQDVLILKKQD